MAATASRTAAADTTNTDDFTETSPPFGMIFSDALPDIHCPLLLRPAIARIPVDAFIAWHTHP
jgi:hypothetical protein